MQGPKAQHVISPVTLHTAENIIWDVATEWIYKIPGDKEIV